jgi:methionyl-tRNA synthetase
MLRDVVFGEDGTYSHAAIVERTNADLANGIGNLAQRSLSMIAKNCNGLMPSLDPAGEAEAALAAEFATEARVYRSEMAALRLNRGLEAVMAMVAAANAYFADAAPWALKASDPARMALVLATTADAVRRIAILAQPAMPGATAKLLDQLGVASDARSFAAFDIAVAAGTALPVPAGVFPRWVEPT